MQKMKNKTKIIFVNVEKKVKDKHEPGLGKVNDFSFPTIKMRSTVPNLAQVTWKAKFSPVGYPPGC